MKREAHGVIQEARRLMQREIPSSESNPSANPFFFAVEVNVKNEQLYLSEFICYYLLQGAEHFFIYDNESEPSVETTIPTALKDVCTVIRWPTVCEPSDLARTRLMRLGGELPMKEEIMRHFAWTYADSCEWVAQVDCDEFVQPFSGTVVEFLQKQAEDVAAVGINWMMFGDAHRLPPICSAELAIETFVLRAKQAHRLIKTIHRPAHHSRRGFHPHTIWLKSGRYVDGLGRAHDGNATTTVAVAQETAKVIRVNHHWWRSESEWRRKLNAKGDDGVQRQANSSKTVSALMQWLESANCNAVYDASLSETFGPLVRQLLFVSNPLQESGEVALGD